MSKAAVGITSPDARTRYCALLSVGAVTEGCAERMKRDMEALLTQLQPLAVVRNVMWWVIRGTGVLTKVDVLSHVRCDPVLLHDGRIPALAC